MSNPTTSPSQLPASHVSQPDSPRILIVDDDPVSQEYVKHCLTTEGYTVAMAANGEAGLSQAVSWSPALIVLDVMMPGLHGFQVLRRLKAGPETAQIGVILLTSKNFRSDRRQALELGAFEVLSKPCDRETLLGAVRRFLSPSGAVAESVAATAAPFRSTREEYLPEIPVGRSSIRFWGTRGSIPVSSPENVRHGGETSCVEIGSGEEMLIIDAGSGIRALGQRLNSLPPRKLHLFITHTHWDHIQGFPFFAPAYRPEFELVIYGASGLGNELKGLFQGQFARDYFPVPFEDMRSRIEFRTLTDEPVRIGNLSLTWHYTHHPSATVGYKVEIEGKRIGYVSDNEFLQGYLGHPADARRVENFLAEHRKLIDFLTEMDLLVHEAQYTNAEYKDKVGWGHSSLSNACLLAKLTRSQRWIVIHHDPSHNDDFLDAKLNLTREILNQIDHPATVTHAYDGMIGYV